MLSVRREEANAPARPQRICTRAFTPATGDLACSITTAVRGRMTSGLSSPGVLLLTEPIKHAAQFVFSALQRGHHKPGDVLSAGSTPQFSARMHELLDGGLDAELAHAGAYNEGSSTIRYTLNGSSDEWNGLTYLA